MMSAAEKDLQNVIFKGDLVSVTNALVQEDLILTSYGDIVDDIRSLVSVFQSFQFVFVHWSCNVVADALAKKAKCLAGYREWLGVLPTDISQIVDFDVP